MVIRIGDFHEMRQIYLAYHIQVIKLILFGRKKNTEEAVTEADKNKEKTSWRSKNLPKSSRIWNITDVVDSGYGGIERT